MKQLIYLIIALAIVVLLGAGGVVGYEQFIASRVDRLLESGTLPSSAVREATAPHILSRFDDLDAELILAVGGGSDSLPGGGSPGAPWHWKVEHDESLHAMAVTAIPVLEKLDRLLETSDARSIIEGDGYFAGEEDFRPWLGTLRHWTNVQSGTAVSNARRGNYEQSAKRLGRACDLARLVDDGSKISIMIGDAVRDIVFNAASHIVDENPDSASALRRELEPRLAKHTKTGRGRAAFWANITGFLEHSRKEKRSRWSLLDRFAAAQKLNSFLNGVGLLQREGINPDGFEFHSSLDNWVCGVPKMETSETTYRRRVELLRVVLASFAIRQRTGTWPQDLIQLSSEFDGGVPIDPVTGTPFSYELTSNELRIAPNEPDQESRILNASRWYSCEFLSRAPGLDIPAIETE